VPEISANGENNSGVLDQKRGLAAIVAKGLKRYPNFMLKSYCRMGGKKKRTVATHHVFKTAILSIALLSGNACMAPRQGSAPGDFNHVGLFWLKNAGHKEDQQKLIDATLAFAREIPEVKSVSVGRSAPKTGELTDASFDVCFVLTFENRAALERYADHPKHEAAARELFLPLTARILFYDFISESGSAVK